MRHISVPTHKIYYIFHIKPHFSNEYPEVISGPILMKFTPIFSEFIANFSDNFVIIL